MNKFYFAGEEEKDAFNKLIEEERKALKDKIQVWAGENKELCTEFNEMINFHDDLLEFLESKKG